MVNSKFCAFVFLILLVSINSTLFSQTQNESDVKIINVSELSQIVKQSIGKPVLINIWATWCEPCREEFPDLVDLSKKYNKNIRFIGISADEVDDLDSKVSRFLKKHEC